jgi:hypothetical protein
MKLNSLLKPLTAVSLLLLSGALAAACNSEPEVAGDGDAKSGDYRDADGDGVLDILGKAVDKDGDGVIDQFDFHGDGTVVGPGVDTNGDGEPDAIGHDLDGDGIIDALDTNGDGQPDTFPPVQGDGDDSPTGDGDIDPGEIVGDGDGDSNPPPGNGMPEVCDGKDTNGDGIIDNVDADSDGICDCLNIGTIGRIGPWSSGGDIFKDWLNARTPIPATELGDSVLTPELLEGLNVIVVLRSDTAPLEEDESPAHHEFSADEVQAMNTWVRAGGGLMTTIGYQGDEAAEIVNVNRLLAPFDAGYDSTKLGLHGFLETWNETHPIANGVSMIFTDNGVEPLTTSGTIVAHDASDRVGIVAHQVDDGRVIVFGDEWVTYDSEWEDTEEQQVELLWLNMIKWLSPPQTCQVPIPITVR